MLPLLTEIAVDNVNMLTHFKWSNVYKKLLNVNKTKKMITQVSHFSLFKYK